MGEVHPRRFDPDDPLLGELRRVCLDLQTGEVDWAEVAELVEDSYRLTAPRRLVLDLGSRSGVDRPTERR